jgi:hypothetical protein
MKKGSWIGKQRGKKYKMQIESIAENFRFVCYQKAKFFANVVTIINENEVIKNSYD